MGGMPSHGVARGSACLLPVQPLRPRVSTQPVRSVGKNASLPLVGCLTGQWLDLVF